MKYVKFTHVDSVTNVPVTVDIARNGPIMPLLNGLVYSFGLESEFPTTEPTFYGTCPDVDVAHVAGILAEVTKAEFEAARLAEQEHLKEKLLSQLKAQIPEERWRREVSGIIWNGVFIHTDEKSQSKLQSARSAARDGLRLDGSNWKCGDPLTGEIIYRPTTNIEMIDIGSVAFNYVQACYNRESVLMAAVADGTYNDDMINTGWPAR